MKWIKVSEKKPKTGERILIAMKHGFVGEGFFNNCGNKWIREGYDIEKSFGSLVVAWMPIPEYKEGEV